MQEETTERLVFSIVRFTGGHGVVTIEDHRADRYLALPEAALPRLRRALPARLVRLVQSVVEKLPPTSHAMSFCTPRPPSAERLSEETFVQSCERLVPPSATRYLQAGRLSEWLPTEAFASEGDIVACVELGLHQWRPIAHSTEHRCAVCGGAASRLLDPAHHFEDELHQLLSADPWRSAARGDYERFARPEERSDALRLLLDVSAPDPLRAEERVSLEYLARQSPDRCAVLVLPGNEPPDFLSRVPAFELSTVRDVHGEEHLFAALPEGLLGAAR